MQVTESHQVFGSRNRDYGGAVVLAIGFWAIIIATSTARQAPSIGYEASIYLATPMTVWIAIGLALVSGTIAGLLSRTRMLRTSGLLLATMAILLVVCLPLIRGYRYLGEDDAMTHLGFARDMAAGITNPTELLYPGIHLIAIALSAITGVGIELPMMLLGPIFVGVFVIAVALSVRTMTSNSVAVPLGVLAALCLLPINGIAVHLQAHPSSMAILYVPAILAVVLIALQELRPASLALVALLAPAFVLLHPLHGANAVMMLIVIALLIGITRYGNPVGNARPSNLSRRVVGIAVLGLVGIAFLVWVLFVSIDQLVRFGTTIHHSLITGDPAGTLWHYFAALAAIDANIGELFAKLFLVGALFSGLAVVIMGIHLRDWHRSRQVPPIDSNTAIGYLAIGFLPIVATALVFFVAGVDTFAFRQIGFAMAIVTILGAIGLARLHHAGRQYFPGKAVAIVTTAFVVILLVSSLLVIYPSPYVYQPMGHVPDAQVTGFDTAFEHRDDEIAYAHLRSLPHRYSDAIHGESAFDRSEFYDGELQAPVADGFANQDLSAEYDEPRYLVVTGADREREPHVFEALRFSEADFEYLDEDRRIDRIHSNDEFDLYLVYPADAEELPPEE